MSTYLACFVVCNFDYKEVDVNANGIGSNFKLRAFAQKDQTHKIDFAHDIGKRATEFYINYYEVPFPLPKLGKNIAIVFIFHKTHLMLIYNFFIMIVFYYISENYTKICLHINSK